MNERTLVDYDDDRERAGLQKFVKKIRPSLRFNLLLFSTSMNIFTLLFCLSFGPYDSSLSPKGPTTLVCRAHNFANDC